jgi:hypothetical protein
MIDLQQKILEHFFHIDNILQSVAKVLGQVT